MTSGNDRQSDDKEEKEPPPAQIGESDSLLGSSTDTREDPDKPSTR